MPVGIFNVPLPINFYNRITMPDFQRIVFMSNSSSNLNLSPNDPTGIIHDHTSEAEAIRITRQEDVPELVEFVLALKMRRPISTDMGAALLTHLVMQQRSTDASQIADKMAADNWTALISDGETLPVLAERVLAYLATHDGIGLFNFFVKTFACSNGDVGRSELGS